MLMSPLSETIYRTSSFVSSNAKAGRKQYGQFFTSESIAVFMASMFHIDLEKDSLRLLDAGAGSGILSVALLSRIRLYRLCQTRLLWKWWKSTWCSCQEPCFGKGFSFHIWDSPRKLYHLPSLWAQPIPVWKKEWRNLRLDYRKSTL